MIKLLPRELPYTFQISLQVYSASLERLTEIIDLKEKIPRCAFGSTVNEAENAPCRRWRSLERSSAQSVDAAESWHRLRRQ